MRLSFRLAARKTERKRSRTVSAKSEWNIPEEVLMEILPRLPAKSLMRFKCVSRLWYSLITSRYLTNLFLKFPSSRRLFMSFVDKEEQYKYALVSSPRDSVPDISPYDSALISDLDLDLNMPRIGGCFVSALRGLLCVRLWRSVRICNLTTRQSVILPIITSSIVAEKDENVWSYFGHDLVQDEYKVLSTVWEVNKEERVVRSEHQVLVLGRGASWRRTTQSSIPPHRPYSKGISINGVLYYGAWNCENACVVVSFDLRSEEFILIELPLEAGIMFWDTRATNLMNYKGKLAVFEYSSILNSGSMDVWVLEDANKSQWSNKKTFDLPIQTQTLAMSNRVLIQATSHSCEIRLAKEEIDILNPRSLIYHLGRNEITRHIRVMNLVDKFRGTKFLDTTFWDDIESIMYLET